MPVIPKVAQDSARYRRPLISFPSARAAFKAFLSVSRAVERGGVLLPAYIGWSPREGSGVLDPVRELAAPVAFYRVDASLAIDLDHLRAQLDRHRPRVLVLIHYFGFVDRNYEHAVKLARARDVLVLEDEAHALLTDLVKGSAGRLGDAAILSLHKLLPVAAGGGLLLSNAAAARDYEPFALSSHEPPWSFDLARLAEVRQTNACVLRDLVAPLAGRVDPLWELDQRIVPQTYPVLIRTVSRDVLYEQMNAAGFGVVSLYHTLVDAITPAEFPASLELSRTILNLPVHQECSEDSLDAMVQTLDRLTRN